MRRLASAAPTLILSSLENTFIPSEYKDKTIPELIAMRDKGDLWLMSNTNRSDYAFQKRRYERLNNAITLLREQQINAENKAGGAFVLR
jgi:hypothetical protein